MAEFEKIVIGGQELMPVAEKVAVKGKVLLSLDNNVLRIGELLNFNIELGSGDLTIGSTGKTIIGRRNEITFSPSEGINIGTTGKLHIEGRGVKFIADGITSFDIDNCGNIKIGNGGPLQISEYGDFKIGRNEELQITNYGSVIIGTEEDIRVDADTVRVGTDNAININGEEINIGTTTGRVIIKNGKISINEIGDVDIKNGKLLISDTQGICIGASDDYITFAKDSYGSCPLRIAYGAVQVGDPYGYGKSELLVGTWNVKQALSDLYSKIG